eukprot:766850-Hanusia_phi.AAC.4
MAARLFWSEPAREARDVLDGLLVIEASHEQNAFSALESRPICLPQIQEATNPGLPSRHVQLRSVRTLSQNCRCLLTKVSYSLGSEADDSLRTSPSFYFSIVAPASLIVNSIRSERESSLAKWFGRKQESCTITELLQLNKNLVLTNLIEEIVAEIELELFEYQGQTVKALKATYATANSIIVCGFGFVSLLAFHASCILLERHASLLKDALRCFTYGMPVMCSKDPEERISFLDSIAPALRTVPHLRRDLPCPHFLHVIRNEDIVPALSLLKAKYRWMLAERLKASLHDQHSSFTLHPFSKELMQTLECLCDEQAGSAVSHAARTKLSNKIQSKSVIPGEESLELDVGVNTEDSEDVSNSSATSKSTKDSHHHDLLHRITEQVAQAALQDGCALGKYWIFSDSVSALSNQEAKAVDCLSEAKSKKEIERSFRRELTGVRRWVVQFPYYKHIRWAKKH